MYSTGTVTRSEAKVSKPLKGEIGGIGLRSPRVGGRGGIHLRIQEIGKNAKGRGVGEWPPGPLGTHIFFEQQKAQWFPGSNARPDHFAF